MLEPSDLIFPDWPAPETVKAFFTTRAGGVSSGIYAGLNLGAQVGDDPHQVAENRRRLNALLPAPPAWLKQIHGVEVVAANKVGNDVVAADAAFTVRMNTVCAVMVADCLPVLFCSKDGHVVAAAHAGWRGLCGGVLENTVHAMSRPPGEVLAWLGPAIGAERFEVGIDVYTAFTTHTAEDAAAFTAIDGKPDKYLADIYRLARRRLHDLGVRDIYGGHYCTVTEADRFFSYRREGKTGRMAGVIWRQ
jgi:polyphenol oxidase